MSKIKKDYSRFLRRRNRSKKTAFSHPDFPRLCVFRSNKHIEAQIIDDHKSLTLVAASSLEKDFAGKSDQTKTDVSKLVGTLLAERALKQKINQVVFDRNGFPYSGRIKSLAEAAREIGLKF